MSKTTALQGCTEISLKTHTYLASGGTVFRMCPADERGHQRMTYGRIAGRQYFWYHSMEETGILLPILEKCE